MRRTLVVNGDDFGLTAGVNAGILAAFREGILTSASIMACGGAQTPGAYQNSSSGIPKRRRIARTM